MSDDYLEVWEGNEDADSQPHGLGVAIFHSGDRYTGYMSHGRREGWGVNIGDQQIYAGYFKGDRPDGQGCLIDRTNSVRYDGRFESGTLVEGRYTGKDAVIEGRWVDVQNNDTALTVVGRGRKLDLTGGFVYEGEMEGVNPHGLGRIWMDQKRYGANRYAGFFNRGALLFCRCYAPKAGNLYLGQCTGSRKTGIGARLSKDGRFFVGHWEADKPSGEGVVYLENCSLVQTVVHQPSGEPKYESAKPIPPSARTPPRASAPVDLDDREAVAVLLRAIMADPVGQAHRAIALLEQLRQEGDDMLQAEPPKVEHVPYEPDQLLAPEKYVGKKDAEGRPHGQGVMMFSSGDIYEGAWEHGKRHGPGRQLYSLTGEMFEGQWQDDKWRSGRWTCLEGRRTVQADGFVADRMPQGVCIVTWKPEGYGKPVKMEAFFDKGRLQVNDVRITHGNDSIFRGTVRNPESGHQFDHVPQRRHGLVFYGDDEGSMYEGDFDELGRKEGGKGFLVQRSGEQVVYEGPFKADMKDGGIGVELHRATGRPYLIEMPFQHGKKHGRGYRATESCTNIKEWRFENDKLVEVKELGARQDERLLRVFQQLTKRIVKAEAEWPAKIHGPFLMDERDKPKGEPTKPVKPSLPNVVRKQRPCGNQHYNAWSAPPTIESDGYEASGKGSPAKRVIPGAAYPAKVAAKKPAPVPAPKAIVGMCYASPRTPPQSTRPQQQPVSAKSNVAAVVPSRSPRRESPPEPDWDSAHQDFEHHALVRRQQDLSIPPLQIPEMVVSDEASSQGGGGAREQSPLSSGDDFQEVSYKKKAGAGNRGKEMPKVKVTALVEPGWKAALVRVLLDEDVRVSHYTVNYFEVARPAYMKSQSTQRSDISEIVIKGLRNGVKYGFNVQVTYWVGNTKFTAQSKEAVRTTPPGAVKSPPPPDEPDRLFVRPMGEDGQVLPLNDGNWPFAAYILGKEVTDSVLANKKYSIKVRLLRGDGHLAVEFCLAREIQEHARKFTVWCREKPLDLEDGFRISSGVSPVLIAGLRNGVTYDVSFKVKWSSGRHYPAEPASVVIEGRPEVGADETGEIKATIVNSMQLDQVAQQLAAGGGAFTPRDPALGDQQLSQLSGLSLSPSPFDTEPDYFSKGSNTPASAAPGSNSPGFGAAMQSINLGSPAVGPINGPPAGDRGGGLIAPPPGLSSPGPSTADSGRVGFPSPSTASPLLRQQPQPPSPTELRLPGPSPPLLPQQQPAQAPSPILRAQHTPPVVTMEPLSGLMPDLHLQLPQQQEPRVTEQEPVLGGEPFVLPFLHDMDPPLPSTTGSSAQKPLLFERCKAVTPPAEEARKTWTNPTFPASQPGQQHAASAMEPQMAPQTLQFGGGAVQWGAVSLFSYTPWIEQTQTQPSASCGPFQHPPQQQQGPPLLGVGFGQPQSVNGHGHHHAQQQHQHQPQQQQWATGRP